MIVANGQYQIHIEQKGDGETVILALPGGPGFPHDFFRAALDRLAAQSYRIVYVDLPGGGRATRGRATDGDFAPYLADLDTVASAVAPTRMMLLGHGWGATLACEYALRRPVDALILVHPLRVFGPDGQDFEAQARQMEKIGSDLLPDYVDRLVPLLSAAARGEIMWDAVESDRWWLRMLETQTARAAWPEPGPSLSHPLGIAAYQDFKGAAFLDPGHRLHDYDLANRVRGLATPTLIIGSGHDANYVAPASIHAAPVARAMTEARLVQMDEYGHFPFVEAPAKFAETVGDFVRTLPTSGSIAAPFKHGDN